LVASGSSGAAWGKIFGALYDPLMELEGRMGLNAWRAQALAVTSGRVLEIGAGTGLNLELYPDGVTELLLAEPEEPMARRLEGRVQLSGRRASVLRVPAEQLPVETASVDVVVSTLVLCTVDDPQRALTEVRRVLKPGGRLVFVEHVRSDSRGLSRWQDRLERPWKAVGHGCRCNRPTVQTIANRHDFQLGDVQHGRLRVLPPIIRPLVSGVAVAV
jgi:ubiquinone/menaquinone biosynthesis C-methylase UbiE